MIDLKEYLSYDDVLMVPQYSTIKSRSDVDMTVSICGLELSNPILVSNMSSLIGRDMICEIIKSGGLAIDHRFQKFNNQIDNFINVKNIYGNNYAEEHYAISIGIKSEEIDNVKRFIDFGGKIICVDIAHLDSVVGIDMLKLLRKLPNRNELIIIAGNVATSSGAQRAFENGADIVKVNIGSGSICSTRVETGVGVPALSAIIEVKENLKQNQFIIADGGINKAGSLAKALAFSDLAMCGNLFSGCEECPGEIIIKNNVAYKEYRGSSTHKTKNVEGVVGLVKVKGKYINILNHLLDGLRSSCSYQDAHNLIELKDNPQLIKISHASFIESLPHDLDIIIN